MGIIMNIMIILQITGYLFLLLASISSSISMNFQKLAQHSTIYRDPRTCQHKRNQPLTSPIICRPYFILALFLSAAASTFDFMALTWLSPSMVGIFGCMSIIINIFVSRIILNEELDKQEWIAVVWVVIGCVLSISVNVNNETKYSPPQLIEQLSSCIYIVSNWVVFLICDRILNHVELPTKLERFGYPFIAGALGAQNVCMGKYIAFAISELVEYKYLTVRLDVLISAIILCIASIIIHIAWLNKGLAKYDASYCIIVYQTAWFMFTILSGIVVYDNMDELNTVEQLCFFTGCFLAGWGVWRISIVRVISNKT